MYTHHLTVYCILVNVAMRPYTIHSSRLTRLCMKRSILLVLIGLGSIFVFGAAMIIANGRPVAQMTQNAQTSATTDTSSSTSEDEDERGSDDNATSATDTTQPSSTSTTDSASSTTPGTYSMTDVALHATANDCWSAINGNVYDLTTWVSRHPGGTEAISRLCGTDGSAAFNRKHSGFTAALDTLILLKISTLAP